MLKTVKGLVAKIVALLKDFSDAFSILKREKVYKRKARRLPVQLPGGLFMGSLIMALRFLFSPRTLY